MPAQTLSPHDASPLRQRKRHIPKGIEREDSDDELGDEDIPWEWIYQDQVHERNEDDDGTSERKRRKVAENKIIGAKMGSFECYTGDAVLLKAEGSNEAWVGIICEFLEDDGEGDMAANFMWFSTENEIRKKDKKRTDFYAVRIQGLPSLYTPQNIDIKQNELYITPSWDVNALAAINGKARIMSLESFQQEFPSGKIPRTSPDFGKTFICRRGCNTRTASYTDEFVWEDFFRGGEDVYSLIEMVKQNTKATRKRRKPRSQSPHEDEDDYRPPPETPSKTGRGASTPQSKRGHVTPGSRKKSVCRTSLALLKKTNIDSGAAGNSNLLPWQHASSRQVLWNLLLSKSPATAFMSPRYLRVSHAVKASFPSSTLISRPPSPMEQETASISLARLVPARQQQFVRSLAASKNQ